MAKASIESAQARQKKQADQYQQEVDFQVEDEVIVTTKDQNIGRPSHKLSHQSAGPYTIAKKVRNAYQLDLPDSIKVHPIFSLEKLCLASSSEPLFSQVPDLQPPIEVNGRDEYEVERVLTVRLHRGKLQYRVKWVGYDDDPNWYPAGNLKNAPRALRDFHQEHPDKPGPPKRLQVWLRAAEDEEFVGDHKEDDRPLDWTPRRIKFANQQPADRLPFKRGGNVTISSPRCIILLHYSMYPNYFPFASQSRVAPT